MRKKSVSQKTKIKSTFIAREAQHFCHSRKQTRDLKKNCDPLRFIFFSSLEQTKKKQVPKSIRELESEKKDFFPTHRFFNSKYGQDFGWKNKREKCQFHVIFCALWS